jgi:hypothetical protein
VKLPLYPAIRCGNFQIGFVKRSLYAFSGDEPRPYCQPANYNLAVQMQSGLHIPIHWIVLRLGITFDPMDWSEADIENVRCYLPLT